MAGRKPAGLLLLHARGWALCWAPPLVLPRVAAESASPGATLEHWLLSPSQESQAIPLVSVASVAAGKAKRQPCRGPEDRLERSLRPQETCDPGTVPRLACSLSLGLLPTPATPPVSPVSVGRTRPHREAVRSRFQASRCSEL